MHTGSGVTTLVRTSGVGRHNPSALKVGAAKEDILEAVHPTSSMVIHSVALAAPILDEDRGTGSVSVG